MYFFSNSTNASFDATVLATKDALKRHGFEVLAEIDMRRAFKKSSCSRLPTLLDPERMRRSIGSSRGTNIR